MSSILLQNMTTYKNVCFLCATNLPWSLDAGYVRRFSSKYLVELPTEQQRAVMFKKLFGQIFNLISDDEFNQLAKKYVGLSGSDIKCCFNFYKAKIDTETRDATHFKFCPYRRGLVVPCSPDDEDKSVREIKRADMARQAVKYRAVTFADLKDVLASRNWRTVQEKDLKLHRDYHASLVASAQ
jgi:SpoVK/Ycf46/Vps4 family AAA+-type ATPase